MYPRTVRMHIHLTTELEKCSIFTRANKSRLYNYTKSFRKLDLIDIVVSSKWQ